MGEYEHLKLLIIEQFIENKISRKRAASILRVSERTISRYTKEILLKMKTHKKTEQTSKVVSKSLLASTSPKK